MVRMIFALFLLVASAAGCSGKRMSGTYFNDPSSVEGLAAPGSSLEQELVFSEDETFQSKTIEISPDKGRQESTASGTYTVKGNDLTMVTTVENGKPAPETSRVPVTFTLSDDMSSFSLSGFPAAKYLRK